MDIQHKDRTTLPGWALPTLATAFLILLAVTATQPGAVAVASLQRFMAFYAGVFALVGMSITIMVGLLATDRILLRIGQRVLAQAVHRAVSMATMAFLVAHLVVKILTGHAKAADAVVFRPTALGLGALAFDLMLLIMTTGILRAWFADSSRPGLWRGLHALSYLAWPVAIVHGLVAGRHPAGWVTWGYVLCLIIVGLALLTRVLLVVNPVDPLREEIEVEEPARVAERPRMVQR
ncbi:MAG: hypothetical protein QOE54_2881 [Streptosporangiaceae bacterium]|nr:hypothetical protein [Streptosporangiaceae bacterium]MDX6430515.1 hypothetical protein [Streptosporangiaceae bacterium]